jgi:hypothetical protein
MLRSLSSPLRRVGDGPSRVLHEKRAVKRLRCLALVPATELGKNTLSERTIVNQEVSVHHGCAAGGRRYAGAVSHGHNQESNQESENYTERYKILPV